MRAVRCGGRGDHWPDRHNARQSAAQIAAVLFRGGAWVNNVGVNPAAETEQVRRSRVQRSDGTVYVAACLIADPEAKSAVGIAPLAYQNGPGTALDRITLSDRGSHTDAACPLVINAAIWWPAAPTPGPWRRAARTPARRPATCRRTM